MPGAAMSAENETSKRLECVVVRAGTGETASRDVVREEPLRVLVNGEPVATVMRTPGAEVDLATGFLLTEGLIHSPRQIVAMSFCPDTAGSGVGVVRIRLTDKLAQQAQKRYRDVFSSCSLCGLEALEAFADGLPRFEKPAGRLHREDVFRLRDGMEAAQEAFRRTGGTHAAALAELPVDPAAGRIIVREDLGRHNALDKVVGAAAAGDYDLSRCLLFLSARMSFEMVAKAARAGISDVAGVSAPSALGVDLARKQGMFLAAFVRGDAMTVYSGAEALAGEEA